jgi:glutamate/tyrosine decarboxylase-like PLP-dependent enzyme
MTTKSEQLQKKMHSLTEDRKLFDKAKSYAIDYLDSVFERRVFPDDEALAGLDLFDEQLPETPGDPESMLCLLREHGAPATVTSVGGRYFGLVIGSVLPPVVAAKWLSDVWDQNSALYTTSPLMSRLETVCERWLLELLGLPEQCVAGFVSGSSMAIFCGLAAARWEILNRLNWDVNSKGLFGAPEFRVVVGADAHGTVFKALAMLGLGRDRVETVPVDDQGRMIAAQLPALDEHTLVIAQAGNVNSGAFDPLQQICDRARAAGAWVHVDGAFGLWAAASDNLRHLLQGMEQADSWSVDAHKTLNAPYDNGIVLCRHRQPLVSALQATGAYIAYGEQRDGMLYTPEMSRRSHAIELWATLKILGKSGVADLVDCLCERARQAATRLRAEGFLVLNEVVFNQVLVACQTPEQTQATLANIQRSGECWCGGSVWQGRPVIRLSVCSWATTEEDIGRTVAAFVRAREIG